MQRAPKKHACRLFNNAFIGADGSVLVGGALYSSAGDVSDLVSEDRTDLTWLSADGKVPHYRSCL